MASKPFQYSWLILSDSALPLGSFAFSSGLESYAAHLSRRPTISTSTETPPAVEIVTNFLALSLQSLASTTIPFLVAAYTNPETASALDDELDASTTCPVTRRASVSQGRALMTVWDKSLAPSLTLDGEDGAWLKDFRSSIRSRVASGHFGVCWGLICRLAKLDLEDVCYVFVFNQARAILSAAVRLGLIGPYQSQGILAMESTQAMIQSALVEGRKRSPKEAGQAVPTLDMYQGRHELLYSRVFNS